MSKRAEQAAMKAYPEDWEAGYFDDPDELTDDNEEAREYFREGYEQAEKDLIDLAQLWVDSGDANVISFEQFLKYYETQSNK